MKSYSVYYVERNRPHPDAMIDMKFITSDCLFTDKWIYKLISLGRFPKPIKLGRMSRWRAGDYYAWRDSHSVAK